MDMWAGGGAGTVQGLSPAKWTTLMPPCGPQIAQTHLALRLSKQQKSEKGDE